MKILIAGAGVIGTVYGWQLSEAGNDVALYFRRGKSAGMSAVKIECLDRRGRKPLKISSIYKPKAVEDFSPDDGYELVIVCVKYNQLDSILPKLAGLSGSAHILFMMNLWSKELFDQYLKAGSYFFAFPSVGGGKSGSDIDCFVMSSVVLGEVNGELSPRVKEAAAMFKKAGFKPSISEDMMTWLITHYVWAASFLGGVIKSGSIEEFAKNSELIKKTYIAMREGFDVCRRKGYEVRKVMPQSLYDWVPLFILSFFSKIALKKPEIRNMVKSHISHSPDEMLKMYYDVLNCGIENNIDMSNFTSFKESIDAYFSTGNIAK